MRTRNIEGYTEQELNRFLLLNPSIDPQLFFKHLNRTNCVISDGLILVPHENVNDAVSHLIVIGLVSSLKINK